MDHLVEREVDLSALGARIRNDDTGASAYDPRVMLKVVLLAYSRGLIASRKIEAACAQNVLYIAIRPSSFRRAWHLAAGPASNVELSR